MRVAKGSLRIADATILPRTFYWRDSLEVAPDLLNKLLVRGSRVGRIVEVEAYRGNQDPASHAFRGETTRNVTMFGRPGLLYVYFSYGMHWCANAVCGEEGVAQAVLIRAVAPLAGLSQMRRARSNPARDRDLTSGPARLCQAFGITGADDGADLTTSRGLRVLSDGVPPPSAPGCGSRIGIREATQHRWRWWVRGDPNLSRPG